MALKDRIFTKTELLGIRMENCNDGDLIPDGWSGTFADLFTLTGPAISKLWAALSFFDELEVFRFNRAILGVAITAFGSVPQRAQDALDIIDGFLAGTVTKRQMLALHLAIADEKQLRWDLYKADVGSNPKRKAARIAACAFFVTSPTNLNHRRCSFAAALEANALGVTVSELYDLVVTALNNHP